MNRGRRAGSGKVGVSMGSRFIDIAEACYAKRELVRGYRRPKHVSHGSKHLILMHAGEGHNMEVRYVLMDYSRGEQLKARMMTRLEAWQRNETLRGTGFAWAICGR